MVVKRDRYWDCVKGFAIISVVLGHGYAFSRNFVYAYHLAMFFFVSGWFYNEDKYGDAPERNLAARIKSIWPKYVTYSVVLILLHLALQDFIGIEMVKERFTFGTAFIYSVESILFHINDYLTGSMWFIPQIILSSALFGYIVWLSRRKLLGDGKHIKDIVIVVLCILFGAVGCFLTLKDIDIAGDFHLQYVAKTMPIYMAAYYSRNIYEKKGSKLLNLPIAILCLAVLVAESFFELDIGIESNPLSFYGLGFAGIYFFLYLSKMIGKIKWLQKGFSVIGEYSFEIMAGNVLIYFLFNAVLSRVAGTTPNEFGLNYYQQYWFIQIPVLLGVPCLVGYAFKRVHNWLIR